MKFVLLCTICISLVSFALKNKSLADVVVFFVASMSAAGIFLTASNTIWGPVTNVFAQSLIALCFGGALLLGLRKNRISKYSSINLRHSWPVIVLSSSVIFAVLTTRSLSLQGQTSIFSGAGRFFIAEDNDKWLNFVSNISSGSFLDTRSGVGGGVAILLIISTAVCELMTPWITGGKDIVVVNLCSVFFSHLVLLSLAPLVMVLAIPIKKRFQFPGLWSSIRQKNYFAISFWSGLLMGSLAFSLAMMGLQTLGHLSFEYLIISLSIWVVSQVSNWQENRWKIAVYVIAGSAFLAWMPVPLFCLAVVIAGTIVTCFQFKQVGHSVWAPQIFTLMFLLIVLVWLSLPSFVELIGSATQGSRALLLIAEGSTLSVSALEFLVLAICIIGNYCWLSKSNKLNFCELLFSYFPVLLLLGYASVIAIYDLINVADGWPHYGTRKLVFGFMLVSIISLLPRAIEGYSRVWRIGTKQSLLMIPIVAICIFAILINPNSKKSAQLLLPTWWQKYDTSHPTHDYELNQYLNPRLNYEKDLSNYPIACLPAPEKYQVSRTDNTLLLQNYLCTRFTVAMHGEEPSGYPLIAAASGILSEKNLSISLQKLSSKFKSFNVLVTDNNGAVKELISYTEYVRRISNSD